MKTDHGYWLVVSAMAVFVVMPIPTQIGLSLVSEVKAEEWLKYEVGQYERYNRRTKEAASEAVQPTQRRSAPAPKENKYHRPQRTGTVKPQTSTRRLPSPVRPKYPGKRKEHRLIKPQLAGMQNRPVPTRTYQTPVPQYGSVRPRIPRTAPVSPTYYARSGNQLMPAQRVNNKGWMVRTLKRIFKPGGPAYQRWLERQHDSDEQNRWWERP